MRLCFFSFYDVYVLLTHWGPTYASVNYHTIGSDNGLMPVQCWHIVNTLRPRQNGRRFPDDIFECNFLNEDVWISIKISLKFVPKGPINNIPALVQIMAWRRSGDKPLSEPMMVSLLTLICVTRPQWVNGTLVTNYIDIWTKNTIFIQ